MEFIQWKDSDSTPRRVRVQIIAGDSYPMHKSTRLEQYTKQGGLWKVVYDQRHLSKALSRVDMKTEIVGSVRLSPTSEDCTYMPLLYNGDRFVSLFKDHPRLWIGLLKYGTRLYLKKKGRRCSKVSIPLCCVVIDSLKNEILDLKVYLGIAPLFIAKTYRGYHNINLHFILSYP